MTSTFLKCLLHLCSGSVLLKQAEELAARYPNTIPIMLDVSSQEGHLESLVQDHDLVIRYSEDQGAESVFLAKYCSLSCVM